MTKTLAPFHQLRIDRFAPVAAACGAGLYLAGFCVTSIFLGSLGVAPTELLKARYIASGVLFALFVTSFALPLWVIWRASLGWPATEPPIRDLPRIAKYVLFAAPQVWGFTAAFASLSASRPEVLLDAADNSAWVPKTLGTAIGTFVMVVICVFIVLPPFTLVWNKGVELWHRHANSADAGQAGEANSPSATETVGPEARPSTIVVMVVVLFLVLFCPGVVSVSTEKSLGVLIQPWLRFLTVSAALAGLGIAGILVARVNRIQTASGGPSYFLRPSGYVFGGAFALTLTLPAYALTVYPRLPQYLGGGRPVEASLVPEGNELADLEGPIAILDRTPERLLALVSGPGERRRVVEIPMQKVLRIDVILPGSAPDAMPTSLPNGPVPNGPGREPISRWPPGATVDPAGSPILCPLASPLPAEPLDYLFGAPPVGEVGELTPHPKRDAISKSGLHTACGQTN